MLPTLEILLLLSTVGEVGTFPNRQPYIDVEWMSKARTAIFYSFYWSFVILGPLLMVNLLIALMASTYEAVQGHAVLEWRLRFARLVLNMELLSPGRLFARKEKPP